MGDILFQHGMEMSIICDTMHVRYSVLTWNGILVRDIILARYSVYTLS